MVVKERQRTVSPPPNYSWRWFASALQACALGAITLLSIPGCSGPALEPWHTEELDTEFTAEKAAEIHSFADYLRLEDALFAQLEQTVYSQTATGPEYTLVRYSAGSAADPQQRQPNWNRSFELMPDKVLGGVLLLHGLTDSLHFMASVLRKMRKCCFSGRWRFRASGGC